MLFSDLSIMPKSAHPRTEKTIMSRAIPSGSSERPASRLGLATILVVVAVGSPALSVAQTAANVAVVINENSAVSQRVGEYYIRQRAIPASNVIRLRTSQEETIDRIPYQTTIERPIAIALEQHLQDRILYIVLTKGVPLRINGTGGLNGTVASVDSELTLLYRRMTGQQIPPAGRVNNPYYLGTKEVRDASRFTHREQDIYLVSRLDAFTVEEALALVDKAKGADSEGTFVLDQRAALVNRTGEDWLEVAAKRLEAQGMGDRVMLDTSPQGVRNVPNVLGYYSWGSNDPRNRVRTFGMGFVPGSLAATFVSSDARTFKQPPAEWVPSDTADQSKWFGGTPQSLIGDLIQEGATGVAGHVAEPYLQSTVRPEILFPAYVAGFNLIEAFYLAMPHLSWQTVVVGDPLCAPFPRKALSREEIEDPIDSTTALPGLFSTRRVAGTIRQFPGIAESVLRLVLRAETLVATGGDRDVARVALEEATKTAPNISPFELQLALLYEQGGQYDRAAERYQRVLDVQPNNAVALNNLAYAIAVRRKSPAEALPLATRAVAAAPNDGTVLDTLAWVEHLLGDDATAAKQIVQATRRDPGNAEIHLHAAIIYAATGARAVAEIELKEALRLAPAFETREDVRDVRSAIAKLGSKK
jgi:uncharacterized protein (TIGR03790 family)